MLLGLKELSHIFALSFKVKGNSLSLIKSIEAPHSLKVLHTSSNSFDVGIWILNLHSMEIW